MKSARHVVFAVAFAAVILAGSGQDAFGQAVDNSRLLLSTSYEAAEASHPAQSTRATFEDIERLRNRNIDATWLPTLTLGGQATYISDVASFPLALPDAPVISNDQYRLGLNVEQVLYAGGRPAAQRRVEQASRQLEQLSVDADVYGVRAQVDAAFFGAMLQESIAATLVSARQSLLARLEEATVGVREGVLAAGALDVLEVEVIKLDQQLVEARENRSTALATLATLTGLTIPDDVVLVADDPAGAGRPEYDVFDAQRELLRARASVATHQRRPTVGVVGDLAYGRPPGQNFFEDSFDAFYNVGLSVRWQPFDWGRAKREVREIEARQTIVDAGQQALDQAIEVGADKARGDIRRIEALIEQDLQIVSLRERISARAATSLAQGTITATDFLLEENAERHARLQHDLHVVQLAAAKARLATTIGRASLQ